MRRKKGVFWRKARTVLTPFLVYYGVYVTSVLLLSWPLQMMAGVPGAGDGENAGRVLTGIEKLVGDYRETMIGIVNSACMLIGAMVLLPMLRTELQNHRQSCRKEKGTAAMGGRLQGWQGTVTVGLTVVSAAASSVGLNILLFLTGLVQNSTDYQEVAQRQYGVAFGIGLLLYMVVSPLAEEIVFRGVIYNRLRRCLVGIEDSVGSMEPRRSEGQISQKDAAGSGRGQTAAIITSGILFGIYHGNLVQGIYGCCMGILMAYLYEKTHTFCITVLFHAVANGVVYLIAHNMALQGRIYTISCCTALLAVAAVSVFGIAKILSYEDEG